jgi:hypothetical protein
MLLVLTNNTKQNVYIREEVIVVTIHTLVSSNDTQVLKPRHLNNLSNIGFLVASGFPLPIECIRMLDMLVLLLKLIRLWQWSACVDSSEELGVLCVYVLVFFTYDTRIHV